MRLKDRVTVITGASAGFGMSRGFPEGFAAEGAHLVLNYYGHPQAAMEEFRKELEETCGVKVVLVQGDISLEETAKELVETAVRVFGRIDILINCAGVSKPKLLVDMSFQEWRRLMSVNLDSVFLTCKYAVPHMIRQGFGRVINIASQVGQKGSVEHCHYSAAKAGMIGFTKSLARELGQYGITCNCVAPGPITTQLTGEVSQEWLDAKAKELVIPRFGTVEEVVPSAIFLACQPDGNLYTGQTLGPNLGDVML